MAPAALGSFLRDCHHFETFLTRGWKSAAIALASTGSGSTTGGRTQRTAAGSYVSLLPARRTARPSFPARQRPGLPSPSESTGDDWGVEAWSMAVALAGAPPSANGPRTGELSSGRLLDLPSERGGVDRREPIQLGLNLVEVGEHAGGNDQTAPDHLRDVAAILRVVSLDLGKRL
jgi:hypothetical protein